MHWPDGFCVAVATTMFRVDYRYRCVYRYMDGYTYTYTYGQRFQIDLPDIETIASS